MSTDNLRSNALNDLKRTIEERKGDSAIGNALASIKNVKAAGKHINELSQLYFDGQKETFAHQLDQSVNLTKHANTVAASRKLNLLRHALTELTQAAMIRNMKTAARAEHLALVTNNHLLEEIYVSQKDGALTNEQAQFLAKRVNDRTGCELPNLSSICDESNRMILAMASNAIGNNLNKSKGE
jgi:hypothetical protein